MAKNRDNCLILLVTPPELEKVDSDFAAVFGPERALHVGGDLLLQAYKTLKAYNNAIFILSYQKTSLHPDLTWLDSEDPGFLEMKPGTLDERIRDVFQLAFFTGAKKAVIVDPLSPELKAEWLDQALEALNDKTVALGGNQDGSFYLLGLTQQNIKLLEAPGFTSGKSSEVLTERAKKAKISVFSTPETYCVNSEDSLRKWQESRETVPHFASSPGKEEEPRKHRRRTHSELRKPENPPLI
jgi:glycosyltransferase A (GT-A) superfamily protein (DUF2064 family)